jgi:hypothetical protein
VAQPGGPAAHERVGELDQAGMAADRAHEQAAVIGVQVPQGRQPQEHTAQLGRGQRRDGDRDKKPALARQRVAAGNQQRARLSCLRQRGDRVIGGRVRERAPAGR